MVDEKISVRATESGQNMDVVVHSKRLETDRSGGR